MSKKKINLFVGSIGAFLGIFVFIAYIPQIYANLQGSKAQPFQPLFAITLPMRKGWQTARLLERL